MPFVRAREEIGDPDRIAYLAADGILLYLIKIYICIIILAPYLCYIAITGIAHPEVYLCPLVPIRGDLELGFYGTVCDAFVPHHRDMGNAVVYYRLCIGAVTVCVCRRLPIAAIVIRR